MLQKLLEWTVGGILALYNGALVILIHIRRALKNEQRKLHFVELLVVTVVDSELR